MFWSAPIGNWCVTKGPYNDLCSAGIHGIIAIVQCHCVNLSNMSNITEEELQLDIKLSKPLLLRAAVGFYQCCGSGQFFSGSGSGSADPVFKIRIRVTSKRPDPTGSGSGSYLKMFLMLSKIKKNNGIFIPNLNILWDLKSKIKNYFDETIF